MSLTAGDILVFLTGQAEIDKAVKQLNDAGELWSDPPPASCTGACAAT